MKRCDKLLSLFAALATGGAMLFATSSADALTLRLDAGNDGFDEIVSDEYFGPFAGPLGETSPDGFVGAGTVNWSGSLPGWSVNVTTGINNTIVNPGSPSELDLNSVNVSGGAGTIILELSDTGFTDTGAALSWVSHIGGTISAAAGSSLQLEAWVDDSDLLFGTATKVVDETFNTAAFSITKTTGGLTLSDPYSATIRITIVHTSSGLTSFDANTHIPEPTTLALLGTGLFGIGAAAWRRRKTTA